MTPTIAKLRSAGIADEPAILDQLTEDTNCTTGCSLCKPYIRLMIQTGRTSFDPIIPEPAQ